jgi:hypothetical protein
LFFIYLKFNLVSQVPEIPIFEVFDKTEDRITIRWNYSLITTSFKYKIQCELDGNLTQIDIRFNQYQCQSLEFGRLYVITMFVEDINNVIQRSKSINANTCRSK